MPPVHLGTITSCTRTHQSNESGKLGVRDVAGEISNHYMQNASGELVQYIVSRLRIKFYN